MACSEKLPGNMIFPILRFDNEIEFQQFVRVWSALYRYRLEHLYITTISKSEFSAGDIAKLFEWKNGVRLSKRKRLSMKKIASKVARINELKVDFNMRIFQEEFADVTAIWKIFLLHIISPQEYAIFDQHVCRAFYYLKYHRMEEMPSSNIKRENIYFNEYLDFFNSLSDKDHSRKKIDEALWAFGKFLKTGYAKIVIFGVRNE